MQLQTDRTGRQVNLLRGAGHARRVHDGKEEFELVDIHLPTPNTARRIGTHARTADLSAADFRKLTLGRHQGVPCNSFSLRVELLPGIASI